MQTSIHRSIEAHDPLRYDVAMMTAKPFEERRRQQSDRRSADRQGKYDRRKNRCGRCALFSTPEGVGSPEAGFCGYYERPITADAFACPYFESI